VNEFEQVGLTAEYLDGFDVPLVKESKVKFVCELVQKIDIELNGTFIILGRIVSIIVPQELIKEDGYIDLEEAKTITLSGLDSYHTTSKLSRLSYAQPNKPVSEL
jgi:flavin reductase (DIM6/NTAB) family NADH-FMN oxidoreductase RutF